jgi:SprT protein
MKRARSRAEPRRDGAAAAAAGDTSDGKLIRQTLRRAFRRWGLPELAGGIRVEYSGRLRRSLALCYADDRLIRLDPVLRRPENRELLREIVLHEAAHVAVWERHGDGAKPHGPEWAALVDAVGYLPRLDFRVTRTRRGSDGRRLPPLVYEHRCDECGLSRLSSTPDKGWRCTRCVERGRPGRLRIRSRPARVVRRRRR